MVGRVGSPLQIFLCELLSQFLINFHETWHRWLSQDFDVQDTYFGCNKKCIAMVTVYILWMATKHYYASAGINHLQWYFYFLMICSFGKQWQPSGIISCTARTSNHQGSIRWILYLQSSNNNGRLRAEVTIFHGKVSNQ